MKLEWVRRFCAGLPHATESVQWEDDLVFKLGGKMFAVAAVEPRRVWLSFRCTSGISGSPLFKRGPHCRFVTALCPKSIVTCTAVDRIHFQSSHSLAAPSFTSTPRLLPRFVVGPELLRHYLQRGVRTAQTCARRQHDLRGTTSRCCPSGIAWAVLPLEFKK